MIFDPRIGDVASASAWIPLIYDTVVLFLTLYRIAPSIRHREAGHVSQRIFKVCGFGIAIGLALTFDIVFRRMGFYTTGMRSFSW
jgi:hypothetical protein